MSSDHIISKKTRNEFREVLVSRVLREIEMEFDSADIDLSDIAPNVSGQRRGLVEQYYASLDFSNWADVRKILKVYESILDDLGEQAKDSMALNQEWARKARENLLKWLKKDGFFLDNAGRLHTQAAPAHMPKLAELATAFDSHELQRQIDRLKGSIDHDPALAIGTAKEILETTCKTILSARDINIDENWEVMELVKQTRKVLKLLPDTVAESAKGTHTIKRILSNLGTIAQGLAELRNLYGTGHGRTAKAGGVSARHARLAVGASTTVAVFLFETHSELKVLEKAA